MPSTEQPVHVLYVEDDPMVRGAIAQVLECDYRVTTTDNWDDDAVTLARNLRPQLIILDIHLGPHSISGLDLGKQMRPLGIPMVALTAYASRDVIARANELGFADFIEKPIAVADLRARLSRVLRGPAGASAASSDRMIEKVQHTSSESRWDSRALTPIVHGFCHDFGNELGILPVLLSDLVTALAGGPGHTADQETSRDAEVLVRQIDSAVTRALNMVKDLKRLASAIDRGGDETWVYGYALEDTLRSMIPPSDPGILLEIDAGEVASSARIPRPLLRHLLLPAIGNAVEALNDRPSTSRTPRIRVEIRLNALEGYLSFDVKDNGPGWPSVREDLWLAVRQGRPFSTRGHERGFGLLNLHRIASALGGRLAPRDAPHGGAILNLLIPWRSEDA